MKSMSMARRAGLAAAGIVAAGVVVLGGSAMADAATATPSPSASSGTAAGSGKAGSNDTAVTGDELAKVTAAVKAKDSAVTVTSVRKDPDGSYDVHGTKAGATVMYDLSADLATFTQSTGRGHGGGKGHGGGSNDTPVTGDELAKVTTAVKAKDSTITVTSVGKDPDGSYDVHGTKAGATVMYDLSADLATFTQSTGRGHGGGKGHGGGSNDTPVTGDELAKVTTAVKAKDSTITVTSVGKDPDGSYDVHGTKAGATVMYDLSADLATFTQHTQFAGK